MTTFSAAWQQVTCCDCKRTYTCTPEDDYWGPPGEPPQDATSGRCFACMLKAGGMNPETTPVRVIDVAGGSTDPRDLSRQPEPGAA